MSREKLDQWLEIKKCVNCGKMELRHERLFSDHPENTTRVQSYFDCPNCKFTALKRSIITREEEEYLKSRLEKF